MEIVSYSTKRGRMSLKLGIGQIRLHRQIKSDEIDIQDHRYRMSLPEIILTQVKMYHRYYVRGFARAWMALHACLESLLERTCDFEPLEHVSRTSATAQTCVRGPGGLPSCDGAESTRNDPRAEENKMLKGQKNAHIYTCVRFPFGMCVT